MKKVITSILVAVSLFGSAKSVEPKVNVWSPNTSYSCMFTIDKDRDTFSLHIIGYENVSIGTVLMSRANSEYDLYEGKTKDGNSAYLALRKDGTAKLYIGTDDVDMQCKKK